MNQKSFQHVLFQAVSLLLIGSAGYASDKGPGFGGLEFFGSSQTSRPELDKILRLKPGASVESCDKAVTKLQGILEQKVVKANVEVLPDSGSYYVVVDIAETGFKNPLVNRRLVDSHHIYMKNEKPMELLTQLKTRLQKLVDEGRPTTERYQDGIRLFEDAPCLNLSESLMTSLKGQTPYLFQILASDPNGERRAMAAELLNWCPDPIGNCVGLIPALEDSDVRVRMAASKYIWARVNLLPETFPFNELIEGLSRQLSRPSHHDRVRALAALLALAKHDPDSIGVIKSLDEEKLKEINSNTVMPSVQKSTQQLLSVCANPPAPKRHQTIQSPESSY